MSELFIGLISGTSMDAVDAALVDFSAVSPQLLATHSHPLPATLRGSLAELISSDTGNTLKRLGALDAELGELFAQAAIDLLGEAATDNPTVRAIGSHGQTVWHQPDGPYPFSLQIGDPNIIAARTGITTVADFRRRDMALRGQGAPLVPAFHAQIFRSATEERAVVNIGGIANITVLPADNAQPVTGFDCGPGNVLMDIWAQRCLDKPYDFDGQFALSGSVNWTLLNRLLQDAYFLRAPPKSTGREYFNSRWLNEILEETGSSLPANDVQSTLAWFTARGISDALLRHAPTTERVLLCGGGIHNAAVIRALQSALPGINIDSTSQYGLDPDWVEAVTFAWLARQTLAGRAGNLPSVTGATQSAILGGIYSGAIRWP
jgi:anhydro-N-acetylmuramic acid kinase